MRGHQFSKRSPVMTERTPFPGGIRLVLTLLFLNLIIAGPLSTAQSMEGTASLTNVREPSGEVERITGGEDSQDRTPAASQAELTLASGREGDSSPSSTSLDQTSSPSLFVPITPCRVADTRNPSGPFGGPRITGGASRNFIIPDSACSVPASATAFSLNVAVVPSGPLGYLTLWPTGQSQPLVATLNSFDGRIKSTAAIIPAGTNGSISAFATNTTDVVIDINGYFTPTTSVNSMAFYPVTPCRIADTRDPNGPLGGPALFGQSTRTLPILSSQCGVSSMARAYSLNFAAVPSGPLNYLTAWPTGLGQPLVSSLNAQTGIVTANAAIVPAGDDGAINVYATQSTNLVIDVNGYFAPPEQTGLYLFPLTPCRVWDTRLPAVGAALNGTANVNVAASPCGVPSAARAYVFNVTAVPSGPLWYITMWPQGQSQPLVATLNADDGAITSNMAVVPTNNGSISVYTTNPTHVVLDIFGYFAPN